MSDVVWFLVGSLIGFIIAKSQKEDPTKETEHLREHNKVLEDDIKYYRNLTNNVINENKELRKKLG